MSEKKNPIATIKMKDGRVITAELYPEKAPQTVRNFIYLANEKKFYDGLIFHRCIRDFVIQGGCPQGIGIGGPGYAIKGEFKVNGFANDIHHEPGVLSMARAQNYNSGGSQFFICAGDCSFLDNQYAGFGKVLTGLETVYEISTTQTDMRDKPIVPQQIETITVETFGESYPKPTMLEI